MQNVSAAAAVTAAPVSSSQTTATIAPASRLSVWCDRVIEMGWLAAIIVVPLFFNIYSSRVFEPDKLTTLRSIAIVMALAWLVKLVEERSNPLRDRRVTLRTPLVIPTLLMVVVYLISTALSVAPRTSLLGSYQRLQGTYTTFSYIVVFFMVLQGLRTRAQLERLLAVVIITSLPVAMYGVLQRMKIDPLPWGGDTVERVASNMGNSIFVAAYLIMAFFLTIYKIVESFVAVFRSDKPRAADLVRAGVYIVIALVNLFVVGVLAGSRGPQLGWLAGIFFMLLLMAQLIRRRKLRLGFTAGSILLGLAGLAFLIWLNFDKTGALANSLRTNVPMFSRLSSVMQTTDGTNVVRVLIWEGSAKLVAPHEPIQNPDGSPDQWNAIRPLIGYGPESMYVAYNRFYPPALANIEARNASPDRSHNETWDSLVITGAFGFLAYMLLFGSVLYFGFVWIGLIVSRFERILFIALWVLGGGSVGGYFVAIGSTNLFGVGVAGGIALGLAIFLIVSAVLNARRREGEEVHSALPVRDQMLLIAIIATVVAHFVEIHTGIAIASTRTHFWVLIGVLVVVGTGMMQTRAEAVEAVAAVVPTPTSAVASETATTRKERRAAQAAASRQQRRATTARGTFPAWFAPAAAAGVVLGLVLGVLAFDFTNNISRYFNPGELFLRSLTELPVQAGARSAIETSLGVLFMCLATLALGTTILVAEMHLQGGLQDNPQNVWPAAALVASVALFIWVAFGTFIAGRLVAFISSGQNSVDNILGIAEQLAAFPSYVYVLIGVIIFVGAQLLRSERAGNPPKGMANVFSLLVALIGAPAALIMIAQSNLQPIQADIVYKQASPWDQQGSRLLSNTGLPVQGWDLAIEHHRRAIQLAPNEDYYYLWLGRALLEKARSHPQPEMKSEKIAETDTFLKVIDDGAVNWNRPRGVNALPSAGMGQQDLLNAAKIILEEARTINPLNTDHSANLARMWLQTVSVVQDPAEKERRYTNSVKEYRAATNLSPNNAQLFNEWANLYIQRGEYALAQERLDVSLGLDKKFDNTRLLRANVYLAQADPLNRRRLEAQQQLAAKDPTDTAGIDAAKATIAEVEPQWRALAEKAVPELEAAYKLNPNNAQVIGQLMITQQQLGRPQEAVKYAETMTQLNAQDWSAWRNLALLYRETANKDKAVEAARRALELAPADQKPGMEQLLVQIGG
jgi:tetratricopeptide (TPR) repeat protein